MPRSPIRLISRNDLFLLLGLAIALHLSFSGPLAQAIDYVDRIDQQLGVRLLPALVVLAVVFFIHMQRKRHEMRAAALSAENEALLANARAVEMERLVAFGEALARSLDLEGIRVVASEHLPSLAGGRGAWAMIRVGGVWQALTAADEATTSERERAAKRAFGESATLVGSAFGDICFPMIVAGTPIGVLGVSPEPPLTEHQRIAITAASALLAVSLKNAELFHEIRETSVRDSLTGCFNRKHSMEVMDGELRRSRRSKLPMSLIMFDLDHFKQINDRFGHLCGDAVLQSVGRQMNAVLRGSDVKCRYGGEEFLVLLPDTPLSGAQRVAETLRREFEEHPLMWNDVRVSVTASFGITAITPGEVETRLIIGRADAALYRAKDSGRNCIRTADEHEPQLSDAHLAT